MTYPDDHDQAADHTFRPDWSLHPGAILTAELEARGMTTDELADQAGLPLDHICRILDQTAGIDDPTSKVSHMCCPDDCELEAERG